MDVKELRSLHEAYSNVYTEEEKWIQKAIKSPGAFTAKAKEHNMTAQEFAAYVDKHPEKFDTKTKKQANLAQTLKGIAKEEFEIILTHLLDEGYANTLRGAEVIARNMSEDWRDSIVEAIEGLRPASERMKGALTSSQRASQQARARREQKKQEELEKAANAVLNQMSGVSRRSSTPMGSTPAPQKSEAPQANRTIKPKVKRDDLASAANEVLRSLR